MILRWRRSKAKRTQLRSPPNIVLLKLPSFFMHYLTLAAPLAADTDTDADADADAAALHLDQNVPFSLILSLSCCCRFSLG